MKRFAFALAFLGLLLVSTQVYATDLYRAVTTHQGGLSTSAVSFPAFDENGRNKLQQNVDGVAVFMTASGFVAIGPTPFASAASNPIAVPANELTYLKASGADIVTIRLETGTGAVVVTEVSK